MAMEDSSFREDELNFILGEDGDDDRGGDADGCRRLFPDLDDAFDAVLDDEDDAVRGGGGGGAGAVRDAFVPPVCAAAPSQTHALGFPPHHSVVTPRQPTRAALASCGSFPDLEDFDSLGATMDEGPMDPSIFDAFPAASPEEVPSLSARSFSNEEGETNDNNEKKHETKMSKAEEGARQEENPIETTGAEAAKIVEASDPDFLRLVEPLLLLDGHADAAVLPRCHFPWTAGSAAAQTSFADTERRRKVTEEDFSQVADESSSKGPAAADAAENSSEEGPPAADAAEAFGTRDFFGREDDLRGASAACVPTPGEIPSCASSACDASTEALIAAAAARDARAARARRRLQRAKDQVVRLVGAGDVAEIERRAVRDSVLDSNEREFDEGGFYAALAEERDARDYVSSSWEGVRRSLAAASRAREEAAASAAASLLGPAAARLLGPLDGRRDLTMLGPAPSRPDPRPSEALARGSSAATVAATLKKTKARKARGTSPKVSPRKKKKKLAPSPSLPPPKAKADAEGTPPDIPAAKKPNKSPNEALKSLPAGKDAESRRLRQLMRNRLSAQASRDRRRRAIEEAQRERERKEEEVRVLEEALAGESRRLEGLARAVGRARAWLGPAARGGGEICSR